MDIQIFQMKGKPPEKFKVQGCQRLYCYFNVGKPDLNRSTFRWQNYLQGKH